MKLLMRYLILFLVGCCLISLSSAYSISNFNNTNSNTNISLYNNMTLVKYIAIPSNVSYILSAYINFSSKPYNYTNCSQETTNSSFVNDGGCNLDYRGSYKIHGGFWLNLEKLYDGDWSTSAVYDSDKSVSAQLNITYYKPAGATGAIWQFKNSTGSLLNYTIPPNCFNGSAKNIDNISLMVSSAGGIGYYCYDYVINDFYTIHTSGGLPNITEEKIYWQINHSLVNFNVSIANTSIFYYNGLMNTTNNKTNDFSAVLNNYLSTCTISNGYCYVPTYFKSFGYGSFYYNDMGITNAGFLINNLTYSNYVYETSRQIIRLNMTYDSEYYSHTGTTLIYNGTQYQAILNSSSIPSLFYAYVDVPLVSTTKNISFYWNITLNEIASGIESYYTSSTYNQTIDNINFTICGGSPINVQYINFTIYNESGSNLKTNATLNGNFRYWLGSGNIQKNLSYINTTANNFFSFCLLPNNTNIYVDADLNYIATGFNDNQYYLRNATLTNISTPINLYLIPTTDSTKFYVDIKNGVNVVNDATVIISKKNIVTNSFSTVSIKLTDDTGSFPLYAYLDSVYQFSIVKDGQLLGVVEKTASCSVAPCSISINLQDITSSIFGDYYDTYSTGVLSNLTYNQTSKIVTYNFVDTTGTAKYFRLSVSKSLVNNTISNVICNKYIYTTAGSLTCNLTDYDGDFFAKTYISRSPEKLDLVISFFISTIVRSLGWLGLFLNVMSIIVALVVATTVSKGNPSTVLYSLMVVIFLLKLTTIFPYSWVVVVSLELVFAWAAQELKT